MVITNALDSVSYSREGADFTSCEWVPVMADAAHLDIDKNVSVGKQWEQCVN